MAVAEKNAATKAAARPRQKAKRRTAKSSTPRRTATSQPSSSKAVIDRRAGDGEGVDQRVLEELVDALIAARNGDFSRRLSARRRGLAGELAGAYNELMATNGT